MAQGVHTAKGYGQGVDITKGVIQPKAGRHKGSLCKCAQSTSQSTLKCLNKG